ncbi:hypothetical protein FRC06_005193 [Ceratobasidium sp. 370]|nr:hypothetical protein FRC06_005193 [Ceratobasidium sp. 370]
MPRESAVRFGTVFGALVRVFWSLVCIVTFRFPAMYRERLRLFEHLMVLSDVPWTDPPTYSNAGDPDSNMKPLRQIQQEEWDRLNVAVSVITATSAAALAIQAVNQNAEVYWLVTTFYSIAFGLSLEGLILITYLTVTAGGVSDEAICRLAKGKLMGEGSFDAVEPIALAMALPAIFALHSSLSLLAGLVTMILSGSGEGVQHKGAKYITATMIPVGGGFVCLCVAVFSFNMATWIEIRGRAKYCASNHPPPTLPGE